MTAYDSIVAAVSVGVFYMMEAISVPPISSDEVVFMTSLKESHAGDYMTLKRVITRPKGN